MGRYHSRLTYFFLPANFDRYAYSMNSIPRKYAALSQKNGAPKTPFFHQINQPQSMQHTRIQLRPSLLNQLFLRHTGREFDQRQAVWGHVYDTQIGDDAADHADAG